MMRHQLVSQTFLLILVLFRSSSLIGQDRYPTEGQSQGGDRRGSYYDMQTADREFMDKGTLTRLYPDPKIYLHNMTLLAHLPEGGGEMMTIGGNRYLVGGGVVVDVTDPKNPVVINHRAPGGQTAYNQT